MSVTKALENNFPIHSDPKIMNGVPVFIGTRVPVRTLFDYLLDGSSVAEFLDNFPSVKKDQVERLLEIASGHVLEGIDLYENTHLGNPTGRHDLIENSAGFGTFPHAAPCELHFTHYVKMASAK